MKRINAIALGTSAGGVAAIQKLFSLLSPDFSLPFLIVQHISPTTEVDISLVFKTVAHGKVLEAVDKMKIESSGFYFAPPDYHLLVERNFTLALTQDDPVLYSRPSINVLFESAARAYGGKICGILLTGANADGAEGLKAIRESGGITIAQDLSEAEVPVMPKAAIDTGAAAWVLTIEQIAEKLNALDRGEETL